MKSIFYRVGRFVTYPSNKIHNTRFWKYHFWLPLLLAISVLTLFEQSSLDIVIAEFWYKLEGSSWTLRKNWFSYDLMHHWGKRVVICIGLILSILLAASWKIQRLRKWRWSLTFSVAAMILLPSFVTTLKNLSAVPCPWGIGLEVSASPYVQERQGHS